MNDTSIEYKKVSMNSGGKIGIGKERAMSADIKKEHHTPKSFSLNMKPLAESWKENKLENFYVLDSNFDKRSNSSSVRNNIKKNSFHSDFNSAHKDPEAIKTEEKELDMNGNSNHYAVDEVRSNITNEKEYASKITEKLNLFFGISKLVLDIRIMLFKLLMLIFHLIII